MSHKILPLSLLLLLAIAGFQCKKKEDPGPLLTGKLIISDGCSQYAVGIVSGAFDPTQVTAEWKDPDNDSVYHNVFRLGAVRGACGISYYGVGRGDTFTFRMDPNPQNLLCFVCAVLANISLPPVTDSIKDVTKVGLAVN
ncbi:MAG TPA: hypothetical protein VNU72_13925 [Puia sp.]|nr:hypothetical protein [Puia sp.]